MDELKKIIDFFREKKDNQDDDTKRKHSLIKLAIYGIFLIVVIIAIRTGSDNTNNNSSTNNQSKIEEKTEVKEDKNKEIQEKTSIIRENDVNYSYMYTVVLDGKTETYIGKRIDEKEKFSYTKNNEIKEYAIMDDNYFILDGDIYHLTDKLDNNFKYCDIEKILSIIETIQPVSNDSLIFNVDNSKLSYVFGDVIKEKKEDFNTIKINVTEDSIQSVEINFNSYISSILTGNHSLSIKMEYANVGKVEDFTIKLK